MAAISSGRWMQRSAKYCGKSRGTTRPRSSRAGVASFRALKVPVYSFCQHKSRRAQLRHTRSAARSNMTAGFSSTGGGAARPMLSYSSRKAAAALLIRSRSTVPPPSGSSARFRRLPPNSRPGSSRNTPVPSTASASRGRASGWSAHRVTARTPSTKVPPAPMRRRPCRVPVRNPARPSAAVKRPLPPAHRSAVSPSPSPAAAPKAAPRS